MPVPQTPQPSVGVGDDHLAKRMGSLALDGLRMPPGLSQADEAETQQLVASLRRLKSKGGRKANIRSTNHVVRMGEASASGSDQGHAAAATIEEEADEVEAEEDEQATSVDEAEKPVKPAPGTVTLTSWKTQEFAYRKTTKIGYSSEDELPTLARGLFTSSIRIGKARGKERIVVRGYDKFFNEGEMPWTKPQAIKTYSTAPYELSFKENGCIIFIAALSDEQLIVTSKHSLGKGGGDRPSHAQVGETWLDTHLASVGKTKLDLARELWKNNETAVAELCDDNFEEHVLAYPPERTGLHLHGLNSNIPQFHTRTMREIEAFAKQWGFLPTRYIEMDSLADVESFCQKVGETGSWQGIPIEGFVVRTHMPSADEVAKGTAVAPPYKPGQVWFYKVKFDEPYLMYRDWRELTRKMLSEKQKWDKTRKEAHQMAKADSVKKPKVEDVASKASDFADGAKSKSQRKKEAKKAKMAQQQEEAAKRAADAAAGIIPPDPPQSRSKRPETLLFVKWCHEKLYGSADGKVKPQPSLFDGFGQNQGIIRLRETFIRYMNSSEGQKKLDSGRAQKSKAECQEQDRVATGPVEQVTFDKTLIVPIAVPGCGKTVLAHALQSLVPDFGHTQSDDVTAKKTAPTFLKNIQRELDSHKVVFADRNNHLFKHRNEIVDSVREWERKSGEPVRPPTGKQKKRRAENVVASGENCQENAQSKKQSVRLVALAWSLDALPLNAIHHICSDRITTRGDNHQSLRLTADKEHEQVLWQFLRNLEPYGAAERGGGDQGHGDEHFHTVIKLDVNASLEHNIAKALRELSPILYTPVPNDKHIFDAIEKAKQYKVGIKKENKGVPIQPVRYYALSIELDVRHDVAKLIESDADASKAFAKLIELKRLNEVPHVTLVHISDLKTRAGGEEDDADKERRRLAQERWDTYVAQSKLAQPAKFGVLIDLIAWDDRAMALGVSQTQSSTFGNLKQLQGDKWRPHITLGTFDASIRPFEGNRVVRGADARERGINCIRFSQPLLVTGLIKGYS